MNVVALRVADRVRRLVWRAFGPRTIGVRGLVVDDGHVLLVRHSYGRPTWHLPGGGVKRRETLVDALARELAEEVGVTITGPVRLHGTCSNLGEGKSDHITVFVVDRWTRDPRAVAADGDAEIDATGRFPAGDLPADTSPGTRRRIDEWRDGRLAAFEW
ncbi:MAG TPA: NUDIX domain-containing protein [Acidimicrobiales bacterium]|nr:NUDIX domain-containing protein [Acidimicrobiales bacterium]